MSNSPIDDTLDDAVSDLHAILSAAGEKPPYLMVGAGSGAVIARAFDVLFPNEIAGFVFIEPDHEDGLIVPLNGKPAPMWSLSADDLKKLAQMMMPPKDAPPPPPPAPPPSTGRPYDQLPSEVLMTRVTFETRMFKARAADFADPERALGRFEADRQAFARLHQASPDGALAARPVLVLSGEYTQDPPLVAMRTKVLALSSNVAHRVVPRSGREVHLYDPAAVARAISDVLDAIRTKAKLGS